VFTPISGYFLEKGGRDALLTKNALPFKVFRETFCGEKDLSGNGFK